MSPLPSTPSDITSYGARKVDYSPPENGETDWTAEEINQAHIDLAQLTRTKLQSIIAFKITAGVASVVSHQSLWGNTLSVIPIIAVGSTGVFNVTLPSTATIVSPVMGAADEVHAINVTHGFTNISGSTLYQHNLTVTSANTFTVRVMDSNTGATPTNPASSAYITAFLF